MWILGLLLMIIAGSVGAPPPPPPPPPGTRVPYAGGFLVSDDRYFEGTVGLRFVRDGHVVHRWCSSGAPIRSGDQVAWVTLVCPESGDITATVLHRARVDGSCRVDQRLPRRRDTSGSVSLLRFHGNELVYRSIDGRRWRTDLERAPHRITRR